MIRAQNRTRTCTSLLTLVPETSASTIPPPGQEHESKKCYVSGKRDSNSRPQPWQGCALPTELFPLKSSFRSRFLSNAMQRYELFSNLQTFGAYFFKKKFRPDIYVAYMTYKRCNTHTKAPDFAEGQKFSQLSHPVNRNFNERIS